MPRGDSYQLQGQQGGEVLSASTSSIGPFRWLQVISDVVLDDLTATNLAGSEIELIGITIPAGIGIGGNFTNVAVASGVLIAYSS